MGTRRKVTKGKTHENGYVKQWMGSKPLSIPALMPFISWTLCNHHNSVRSCKGKTSIHSCTHLHTQTVYTRAQPTTFMGLATSSFVLYVSLVGWKQTGPYCEPILTWYFTDTELSGISRNGFTLLPTSVTSAYRLASWPKTFHNSGWQEWRYQDRGLLASNLPRSSVSHQC